MKSRGIRITEIFFSAKTLKKGNQACVSRATPIFYIHCYKQFIMFKWFKIAKFLRQMRKKYNRYDFKIVTSDREVIIYMAGEEDELRLRW